MRLNCHDCQCSDILYCLSSTDARRKRRVAKMFNKILTVKAPATNTGSSSEDRRFSLLIIESAAGCDVRRKLKLLVCICCRSQPLRVTTHQKLVIFYSSSRYWQTRRKNARFSNPQCRENAVEEVCQWKIREVV